MGDRAQARRALGGVAAAIVALGLGATGCSPDSASSLPSPTTAAGSAPSLPAPNTLPAATDPGAIETTLDTTAPSAPAIAAGDGAALLHGAIATMSAGYHFTTTLTVDGAVVLTADGDRVGDGTRLAVTQGDVSVQYVITPAATWVQPEGGDWQQLDTASASTDPIAALASPSAVAITAVDGTATIVNASVPAAALGLSGDSAVSMSARIDNGEITSVGYDATIDGKPAVMQASIGPVVDGSPVVAPI